MQDARGRAEPAAPLRWQRCLGFRMSSAGIFFHAFQAFA